MACFCLIGAYAAYLKDVPMTLTQPDGTVLHCYASGDEFFNYLHDANGYTIMQHPQTGFYVYVDKRDGQLVVTDFVAGRVDPASKNLKPFNLISPEEWIARRKARQAYDKPVVNRDGIPNHGTLNNLSIFIRFSDDTEFTNSYSDIDNMFNDVSENAISMRSYFRSASYGAIEIPTTFYPGHSGDVIISYQDIYPRGYYRPYNGTTNPDGYHNDTEYAEREFSLLERAVNYINDNYPVPTDLNIDYDNDGLVDNVCFIVRGNVDSWTSLLWPHQWNLYGKEAYINGKRVWSFNFQLADATDYFNTSVMCHEMNHSLGAPDLYHYNYGLLLYPVGDWDLMGNNAMPPQHCGAYMKMKYGHWLDEIPEITEPGVYTLNPISSATPTNIAYKIQSDDPNQYYVLEYRDNTSLFETALPGSGLLIYRIDTRFEGNADYRPSNGIYDEIYLFRPEGSASANGNLSTAHFSSDVGRTEFSASTNPYPFFTGGTVDNNFKIYNITSAGNTISFNYGYSNDCEPPTNLVATVEDNNVSLSWDAADNAVSYNIYRNETFVGNTTGTTYLDINPGFGIHTYYLRSVDANGLFSSVSETVLATILPEGTVLISDGGTNTNNYLPSYTYYKYSLTQQIYTTEELGEAGVITSIAFYNGGATKTRKYNIYMVATDKSSFSNNNDWVAVTVGDKVFSGNVTMAADAWTVINLSTPFSYNGISNVLLVTDDNTGSYSSSPHQSCRVLGAPRQALYAYDDDTNFNPLLPTIPSSVSHAVLSVKNQIMLGILTSSTFTKTINAYSGDGGYYLIASPIGEVAPTAVENMISNNFDLYYFDQADDEGNEWINYEGSDGGYNLFAGKGYLYANSQDVTLTFTGNPISGDEFEVMLSKASGTFFEGWNLVGNPFAQTAYITKPFYTMNEDGSEVIPALGNSVGAMEGIFVIANEDGETMTFSTTETSKNALLALNLGKGASTGSTPHGIIDRTIVGFDQAQAMRKFQLRDNSSKIYIPMDNIDYAVFGAGKMGEIPVSFKAETDGTYTLGINKQGVDFSYLHLIDNLTGTDVDLLATTSYVFDARTTDYASRFRLVFAVCEDVNDDNDDFAFISNGNIIVTNAKAGATLQIVDMLGRVIVSRSDLAHSVSTMGIPAGVYVLHLIEGGHVRTQKMVVQ